ncbi:MAG: YncE family protein [Myxococcota bacterium]
MAELLQRLETVRGAIHARAWLRVLLIWLDLVLMSVLAFEVSLQFLLGHLGVVAMVGVALLGGGLIALMNALLDPGTAGRTKRLVLELICPVLLLLFLVGLQTVQNPQKGMEFSFITTELIKLPFWIWLLFISCTAFSVLFLLGAIALTVAWHRAPEHRWVVRIPRLIAWWFAATVMYKLAFSWTGSGLGGFLANAAQAMVYVFIFASAPGALAWFARRGYHLLAARLLPSSYILMTLFLSYAGMIPLYGPGELALTQDSVYIEEHPAVSIIAEPPDGAVGRSFTFLRQIQRTPGHLFASYGPSCGIISLDMLTKEVDHLHIPGLFRDMQMLEDPYRLWALNWRQADLLLVDPIEFEIACTVDLFAKDIPKPYFMAWHGETLYLTNGTPPRLFELKANVTSTSGGPWRGGEAQCDFEVVKMVDLHEVGYTPYQDAIHYSYFHAPTRKIYLSVGILEETYMMGLVEVDVDTFEVTRDLRLPAGGIFFNESTDTFLLPSFYYDRMYEARRDDLTVIREFPADPRSFKVAFDVARQLIYASSRITGTVRVIDYATGETLHNLPVGAKSEPLYYDEKADALFTGGASGIVQIDLARLLGPRPITAVGGAHE